VTSLYANDRFKRVMSQSKKEKKKKISQNNASIDTGYMAERGSKFRSEGGYEISNHKKITKER
jgi:hypothetical protein